MGRERKMACGDPNTVPFSPLPLPFPQKGFFDHEKIRTRVVRIARLPLLRKDCTLNIESSLRKFREFSPSPDSISYNFCIRELPNPRFLSNELFSFSPLGPHVHMRSTGAFLGQSVKGHEARCQSMAEFIHETPAMLCIY